MIEVGDRILKIKGDSMFYIFKEDTTIVFKFQLQRKNRNQ